MCALCEPKVCKYALPQNQQKGTPTLHFPDTGYHDAKLTNIAHCHERQDILVALEGMHCWTLTANNSLLPAPTPPLRCGGGSMANTPKAASMEMSLNR